MKAERRQELKQNDLGAFILDISDWVKKYSLQVGGGLVVFIIILLVSKYVTKSQASSLEADLQLLGSLSFSADADIDQSFATLDDLIRESGNSDFTMRALLRKGRTALFLSTGSADGFKPEYLDKAEEACNALLASYGDRGPIAGAALSMLATVEENRFALDGLMSHQEKTRAYLERLQSDKLFKATPFQTQAAARLKTIDEVFQTVTLADPLPADQAGSGANSGTFNTGSAPQFSIQSASGQPLNVKTTVVKPGAINSSTPVDLEAQRDIAGDLIDDVTPTRDPETSDEDGGTDGDGGADGDGGQ